MPPQLAAKSPAPTLASKAPAAPQGKPAPAPGAAGRAGNRAMVNLFRAARSSAPPPPAAGLAVSSPTDPSELEADRVADAVMRMPAPATSPVVHRKCAACAEEDEKVHRAATADGPATAPPSVAQVLSRPGRPLPGPARAFFEPRLGADLSGVRIHDDGPAADSARAVNARAYTVGSSIAFAAREYSPETAAGRHLLAHELAHVVQGGGPALRRDVFDDLKTGVGGVIDDGKAALGQAVDGVTGVVAGAQQAVGGALDTATGAVGGVVDSAGQAVSAVGAAVGGVVDRAGQAVGDLAIRAANALAKRFGGSVVRSPDGGIDILLPSVTLMKVQSQTRVLPLGIDTSPAQLPPIEVGPFIFKASFGEVYGDPTGTLAYGPVVLQNVKLHLDPFGSTYSGSAQLTAGAGVSGSVEHAQEIRVQALGVILEIPVEASAAVGSRVAYRVIGKGRATQGVALTYRDGEFQLDLDTDIQLGVGYEIDLEAFAKLELETFQVCEIVWPFKTQGEGVAFTANLPLTLRSGKDGEVSAEVGDPTFAPFPFASIVTPLVNGHAPPQCLKLEEIAQIYCKSGKLPPAVCAIFAPGGPKATELPGGFPFAPTETPDEPSEPQADPCAGFTKVIRAPSPHSSWKDYVLDGCSGSTFGNEKLHGHHVVMKGDRFTKNAQARAILCKYGINPFVGCANLAVTPNRCHSGPYADTVLSRLKQADKPGATARDIATVLLGLAQVHASCSDLGEVDPDTDED